MPELVQQVLKRSTVEVHIPDGRVFSGTRGTTVEEFLRVLPEWEQSFIVGAVVNNDLRELTYPIEMDARVSPVTMRDSDGSLIYRRSIIFLMEAAFEDMFPNLGLSVDHSVSSGGFFCQVMNHLPLTKKQVSSLENHMWELVKADLHFERQQIPLEEAVKIFKEKGFDDKVLLLKYRHKSHLVMYRLEDHWDYHHGYMVPSTGYLKWFALQVLGNGFVLKYPLRQSPDKINAIMRTDKLLETFQQYGDWLDRLGVSNVGALDAAIEGGRIREIILISEALHEQKIAQIATRILEQHEKARLILIAGPSSSGKTTFSKRLAVQLLAHGISPFPLELDNYFVNREQTPRDEKGDFDFETIRALDTTLLNQNLRQMIAGEEIQLPKFNFQLGQKEAGEVVRLKKDQLLILEGIHGLNPELISDVPAENTVRIYASCLTQLNLDRYNRISTTDSRLIRRIVRDARERGYSAQQTIGRWESVQRGEKKHIFPYQEYANEMFNSALVYELSALKPLAEPLLRQVPYGTQEYIEAKRLLVFLEWFLPIDTDLILDNSILREFIGGSILKEFKLWSNSEL
jgi:uridine kinase